jgi:hypothetical protein
MICWPRVLACDADDVADRRVGVEAEQQVRRREMEERQRVALDDLPEVDDPAQVGAGRRRLDGHDVVDRLRRGDQVAHRADPADAGHEGRHLVDGTALGDPLEAPELGHVEVRVDDLAAVVELDGDPRVAFDPGDGIDDDGRAHGASGPPQRPNRAPATAGVRPDSRSSSRV